MMKRGFITVQRLESYRFPSVKKFPRAESKVKQMMIFAYDDKGIMTDRVPCRRSMNGVYYCGFMQELRKKNAELPTQMLVAGPLTFHDNARPHIEDIITNNLNH